MKDWHPTWTPASEEEIAAQFHQARQAYEDRYVQGLVISQARYDQAMDRVIIDLRNGVTLMFPPAIAQGLQGASPEQLSDIKVSPGGLALNWDALDAGFELDGLLRGMLGNPAWMERQRENARKAGSTTSEAKAQAARENGKKGGRPKKRVV